MEQVFDDFVEIAVAANQNMSTDFRHQTICTIELTGTLLLLLADGSWYTTAVPLDFDSVVPVSSIRTKTQRRKWWWRLNARTQPIIEKINQTSLFSWPTTHSSSYLHSIWLSWCLPTYRAGISWCFELKCFNVNNWSCTTTQTFFNDLLRSAPPKIDLTNFYVFKNSVGKNWRGPGLPGTIKYIQGVRNQWGFEA